jgi:hypothetical protein
MKVIGIIFSMLIAGTAFAQNFEAMSWAQVLRQYDVDYSNKVHFQNASTWVFAMDKRLCTDGTFIYGGTIEKKWYGEGSEVIKTQKVDLVQPIVSERQICATPTESGCDKWQTVVYRQSPNRVIDILPRNAGDNAQPLGNKSYTIPACGSLSPVDAN